MIMPIEVYKSYKLYMLIIGVLSISVHGRSQQLNNALIGFQEPEARIFAHTVDPQGNFYYLGNFKGELVIKGQVKAVGNGGQDMFLAKTDNDGNLLWVKAYGDAGDDLVGGPGKQLVYHNDRIYFMMYVSYSASVGGLNAIPYAENYLTSFLIQADSNGNLNWIKRNNLLNINGILANRGSIYIVNLFYGSSPIYYEDTQIVEPTTSLFKDVIIKVDTTGNYITAHFVYSEPVPDGFALFPFFKNTEILNPNSFISILQTFENKIIFGATTIPVCDAIDYNFRSVIVKYDSSFNVTHYKVLNPSGETISSIPGFDEHPFPNYLGEDHIDLILNSPGNSGNFKLDDTPIDIYGKNVWITLDQDLKLVKHVNLGNHSVNSYNRINFESLQKCGDKFMINGSFFGQNEAYDSTIHGRETITIPLFSDQIARPFNLRGPSSQFIISCNADLSAAKFLNKGSLELYELPRLNYKNTASTSRMLSTAYGDDNIWNPWIIDTGLNVLSGNMQQNADQPDGSSFVRFLKDGSKYLVVSAKGKTSLDTSTANIRNNSGRTDILISRLDTNNNVIWYKRIQSTWRTNQAVKVVVKNDTLYLGINCIGGGNGTLNFLKIDSITYTFTFQTKALIKITREGKVSMLTPDFYYETNSFDVSDNQDLYVIKKERILKYDRNLSLQDSMELSGIPEYFSGSNLSGTILVNSDSSLTIDFPFAFTEGSSKDIFFKINGVLSDQTILIKPSGGSGGPSTFYLGVVNIKNGKFRWAHVIGPYTIYFKQAALVNNRYTCAISFDQPCYFNEALIAPSSGSLLLQLNKEGSSYKTKETTNWSWGGIQGLGNYRNYLFTTGSSFRSGTIDGLSYTNEGGGDALGVLFDTTLTAIRLLKLSSAIDEKLNDIDIYNDTLLSFAYDAQGDVAFSSIAYGTETPASGYTQMMNAVSKYPSAQAYPKLYAPHAKHNMMAMGLIHHRLGREDILNILTTPATEVYPSSTDASLLTFTTASTVKPSDRKPNAYVSTLRVAQNFLPKYYSIEGNRICNSLETNLAIFGGNPPFRFNWTGPNRFSAGNLNIKARSQGVYTLTVTDASNWSVSKSFNLEALKSKVLKNEIPRECGQPFGSSITLTGSGGTGPYSFKFDNSATFSPIATYPALGPRKYLFVLKDADNCEVSDSTTITDLDGYEPNNTQAAAKMVASGDVKTGRISVLGDVDWFRLSGLSATDYKISITSTPAVLVNVDLYSSSGAFIKPKRTISTGLMTDKIYNLRSNTSYGVRLSSNQFSAADQNCYLVSVSMANKASAALGQAMPTTFAPEIIEPAIEVAPNPGSGVFNIYFKNFTDREANVTLTNAIGQVIQTRKIFFPAGSQYGQLDLTSQPKGLYLLHLRAANISKTIKLMVK